jgi:hypothetical protein
MCVRKRQPRRRVVGGRGGGLFQRFDLHAVSAREGRGRVLGRRPGNEQQRRECPDGEGVKLHQPQNAHSESMTPTTEER